MRATRLTVGGFLGLAATGCAATGGDEEALGGQQQRISLPTSLADYALISRSPIKLRWPSCPDLIQVFCEQHTREVHIDADVPLLQLGQAEVQMNSEDVPPIPCSELAGF